MDTPPDIGNPSLPIMESHEPVPNLALFLCCEGTNQSGCFSTQAYSNVQLWCFPCWSPELIIFISTSWHGNVTGITGPFQRNPPVDPSQRASNAELWHLLYCYMNKLLNKEWSCRWFETPQQPCDITVINVQNISCYTSATA